MSSKRRTKKITSGDRHSPDKSTLVFMIAMAIFGAIMIYDASVYKANQEPFNNQFHFLILQLAWLLFGGILAYIAYIFDYRKILKFSFPFLIGVICLLVLVLAVGDEVNGSKRWFQFGSLPPIQPAEFAKLAVVMYFASWFSKKEYSFSKFEDSIKKGFLKVLIPFLAVIGIVGLLVVLEPDLGTAMIIFLTAFIMLFLSGKDNAHRVGSLAMIPVIFVLGIIAILLEPYRMSRIQTFFNLILKGEVADPQGTGYQMQQILIGIGSGGILGKGFGQSRQRFGYLVENTAFTDSTFAVLLEELGLLGGAIVVISWIFFLWRGFKIALGAPDKEGQFLATGISVWLSCQAFFNMAANVGIIPLTGIPLPFLTYGGSSTMVTMIAFGLLLNVSRYTKNA
ncbi:MAG TPA: putative peptidoglycan glycosyltransferase FtsW [Candidatus Dojkabacteria bacterium]|nr:putative peptidoglycan glycosyltransferase FtsW [Candidatus Dojkabacteria bacterium]